MKELGIAVVGCGFWANEMHLPAFQKIGGVRVMGVASRTEESARKTAERFGMPRWTTDYRELLKDPEVDVVDILTPNYLHAPIAVAAAGYGKHVFCIKPLAMNLQEADQMMAAAGKAGVELLYAENVPFVPATGGPGKSSPRRIGRRLSCQGVRRDRDAARPLVFRPCPGGRRRHHRHGRPRPRLLPLDRRERS